MPQVTDSGPVAAQQPAGHLFPYLVHPGYGAGLPLVPMTSVCVTGVRAARLTQGRSMPFIHNISHPTQNNVLCIAQYLLLECNINNKVLTNIKILL